MCLGLQTKEDHRRTCILPFSKPRNLNFSSLFFLRIMFQGVDKSLTAAILICFNSRPLHEHSQTMKLLWSRLTPHQIFWPSVYIDLHQDRTCQHQDTWFWRINSPNSENLHLMPQLTCCFCQQINNWQSGCMRSVQMIAGIMQKNWCDATNSWFWGILVFNEQHFLRRHCAHATLRTTHTRIHWGLADVLIFVGLHVAKPFCHQSTAKQESNSHFESMTEDTFDNRPHQNRDSQRTCATDMHPWNDLSTCDVQLGQNENEHIDITWQGSKLIMPLIMFVHCSKVMLNSKEWLICSKSLELFLRLVLWK